MYESLISYRQSTIPNPVWSRDVGKDGISGNEPESSPEEDMK